MVVNGLTSLSTIVGQKPPCAKICSPPTGIKSFVSAMEMHKDLRIRVRSTESRMTSLFKLIYFFSSRTLCICVPDCA